MIATTQEQFGSRLSAQGDFGSVDAEDPGVASGCAQRARHSGSRQKPKFHKALCDVAGEVDTVEDAVFAFFEFRQTPRGPGVTAPLVETQLHYVPSMELSECGVNTPYHINATEKVLVSELEG